MNVFAIDLTVSDVNTDSTYESHAEPYIGNLQLLHQAHPGNVQSVSSTSSL